MNTDAVKILRLVLPEVDFSHWFWVLSVLEGVFWVLLEDVFDLFLPMNYGG